MPILHLQLSMILFQLKYYTATYMISFHHILILSGAQSSHLMHRFIPDGMGLIEFIQFRALTYKKQFYNLFHVENKIQFIQWSTTHNSCGHLKRFVKKKSESILLYFWCIGIQIFPFQINKLNQITFYKIEFSSSNISFDFLN